MKHIGKELYDIIERKHLIKKDIAEKAGLTPVYLSAIMRKDDISCSLLDRICKVVGVAPAYFFNDSPENFPYEDNAAVDIDTAKLQMKVAAMEEKINLLESLLKTKDELLAEKDRYISAVTARSNFNNSVK